MMCRRGHDEAAVLSTFAASGSAACRLRPGEASLLVSTFQERRYASRDVTFRDSRPASDARGVPARPHAPPRGGIKWILAIVLVAATLGPGAAAEGQHTSKTVLVLLSGQASLPSATAALTGLRSSLREATGFTVSIYVEHVYWPQPSSETDERRLRDGLRAKYSGIQVDGIAAFWFPATRFLARWGADLWPDVPGVAFAIEERLLPPLTLPPRVTLVPMRFDLDGTVRLARALLPGTRRVALLSGASQGEQAFADLYRSEVRSRGDALELVDLTGLPLEELLQRLAALPDRTIILGSSYESDGRGRPYFWADIAPAVSAAAAAPIFTPISTAMGTGVVGGSMVDIGALGQEAGRMLLRLLAGETVPALVPSAVPPRVVVDWNRLKRWGLDEGQLPPGSGVLNRQPTTWERFRSTILAGLGVIVTLSVVVVGLLVERRRRRRVQGALEQRLRFEGLLTETLRASEALSHAVLASLPSEVAVIDKDGVILHVNERWRAFAREHGVEGCSKVSVGANYLEECRRAAREGDGTAARALEIIEAVLAGKDGEETLEYLAGQPGEDRWFEMGAQRLDGTRGAALIIHRDITDAKRSAAETRRALGELAHRDRVAAVGELASSLAHELNQPLAAILANAQAARRWLATGAPSLAEVREVLDDIIADDQRAAEVIRRMRDLLRKGEPRRDVVDVNEVVRETTRLVRNDAMLRAASITVETAPELPTIRGDAVQLQQVLLNLLVNGLHAVTNVPQHRRRLLVRTANTDGRVDVAVQDAGPGIPASAIARIFEPFFTTRGEGLGIGLAVSRSIIEAHGGRIWAENDPDGGAVFKFSLPVGPTGRELASSPPRSS
jgi:C4-dicarboxylate-specific signal transduction histidine kinase